MIHKNRSYNSIMTLFSMGSMGLFLTSAFPTEAAGGVVKLRTTEPASTTNSIAGPAVTHTCPSSLIVTGLTHSSTIPGGNFSAGQLLTKRGQPTPLNHGLIDSYINIRYSNIVIQSIKGQLTQDVFDGKNSKEARRFDQNLHAVARRKLDQLNAATRLDDLRIPPGNRLEVLSGNLKGLHSIRINDQWRIMFRWTPTGPEEVRIEDYH